jgi:hypothetical protein
MARPTLPLGTMGEIRCYAYGKGFRRNATIIHET